MRIGKEEAALLPSSPPSFLPVPPLLCRKSDSWSGIRRTLGGHAGAACLTAAAAAVALTSTADTAPRARFAAPSATFLRATDHLQVHAEKRSKTTKISASAMIFCKDYLLGNLLIMKAHLPRPRYLGHDWNILPMYLKKPQYIIAPAPGPAAH